MVAEFDIDAETHPYITEADFLRDGAFDIYWDGLSANIVNNSATRGQIGYLTEVVYAIFIGDRTSVAMDDYKTEFRVLPTLVGRVFEKQDSRTIPTDLAIEWPGQTASSPLTLSWRIDEPGIIGTGKDVRSTKYGCSYTAFRVQIVDDEYDETISIAKPNGENHVIFLSDAIRMPVREEDGRYKWTVRFSTEDKIRFEQAIAQYGHLKIRVHGVNAAFLPSIRYNGNNFSEFLTFPTSATS